MTSARGDTSHGLHGTSSSARGVVSLARQGAIHRSGANNIDLSSAAQRCRAFRRRILDISQKVTALHVAPAFSCMEISDVIYHELMQRNDDGFSDVFLMSKGHGCLAQYVILESLGILSSSDLDLYCTADGKLGAHPDLGVPGIAASTGSLGHGLGLAAGQAYAEKLKGSAVRVFCVLSDGEFQEGSTWEAMMTAANLGLGNLIAFIDNNDFSGLERMSSAHKAFYPLREKLALFGWETAEVDGHDAGAIFSAVTERKGDRPLILVCKTVKGKGVSFMESVPIWHYRSPNPEEYEQAVRELDESRK